MPEPWPKVVDHITPRYPSADEIEGLVAFRNLPEVNQWMLRTHVDAEVFRAEWSAVATSDTDFSCVAILDGGVVGMGFLELSDGMGQPGWPKGTEAGIGYIVRPGFPGEVWRRLPRADCCTQRSSTWGYVVSPQGVSPTT